MKKLLVIGIFALLLLTAYVLWAGRTSFRADLPHIKGILMIDMNAKFLAIAIIAAVRL